MSNKKQDKIGVYTCECIDNTNKINIKHLCNENIDKKIVDTCVKKYDIDTENNIYGAVFRCNLTHFFLERNKKIPIFYINVCLANPIRVKLLYQLYFYFEITSQVKCQEDLFDKPLTGIFSIVAMQDTGQIELKRDFIFENINNQILDLMKFTSDKLLSYAKDIIKESNEEFNQETFELDLQKNIIKYDDIKTDSEEQDKKN